MFEQTLEAKETVEVENESAGLAGEKDESVMGMLTVQAVNDKKFEEPIEGFFAELDSVLGLRDVPSATIEDNERLSCGHTKAEHAAMGLGDTPRISEQQFETLFLRVLNEAHKATQLVLQRGLLPKPGDFVSTLEQYRYKQIVIGVDVENALAHLRLGDEKTKLSEIPVDPKAEGDFTDSFVRLDQIVATGPVEDLFDSLQIYQMCGVDIFNPDVLQFQAVVEPDTEGNAKIQMKIMASNLTKEQTRMIMLFSKLRAEIDPNMIDLQMRVIRMDDEEENSIL